MNRPNPTTSPAIQRAMDAICTELGLKASHRRELVAFIADLGKAHPKLPHVSFYAAKSRGGAVSYRITYKVPGYRPRTERLGRVAATAYKRAQRVSEILQQVKARLMKPEAAHRQLYVDSTPISRHVSEFKRSVAAQGVKPEYLRSIVVRLGRCIDLADFARLSDIRRDSLAGLTEQLKAFSDPQTKRKITTTTINGYLAVLRQFTRWAVSQGKLEVDPLALSRGVKNVERAKRRDILPDELAHLVDTTRTQPTRAGMTGQARACLYLMAGTTGLRRSELMSTRIEWLKLDDQPASVTVPAKFTKTNKDAFLPLIPITVAELRSFLGDRSTGQIFAGMKPQISQVFDLDREAARASWLSAHPDKALAKRDAFLARKTGDGELVFHSLRHSFGSMLVKSGMPVKDVQALTRHATAAMLTEVYAHARISEAAAAVERAINIPLTNSQKALAQGAAQTRPMVSQRVPE